MRAENLARVPLERLRHDIAPETADRLLLDSANEETAHANHEPEQAVADINGLLRLWAGFSSVSWHPPG